MKTSMISALYGQGIFAANAVPVDDVLKSMAILHPYTTEHELIRLGGDGDGGYLVPDDLDGIKHCFSPGVSDFAGFEEELAERGIDCFLADYSVDQPPIANPNFRFEKKYLGSSNDEIFCTLEDWVGRNAPADDDDMILQMDIEGAEYATLLAAHDELLARFRIIVMELHYLRDMMTPFGNQIISEVFAKLTRNHVVVHSHPNNWFEPFHYRSCVFPSALEVTFLRKDRITQSRPTSVFPHKFDRSCADNKADLMLPSCWRSPHVG